MGERYHQNTHQDDVRSEGTLRCHAGSLKQRLTTAGYHFLGKKLTDGTLTELRPTVNQACFLSRLTRVLGNTKTGGYFLRGMPRAMATKAAIHFMCFSFADFAALAGDCLCWLFTCRIFQKSLLVAKHCGPGAYARVSDAFCDFLGLNCIQFIQALEGRGMDCLIHAARVRQPVPPQWRTESVNQS
jgi:hypothetical protein